MPNHLEHYYELELEAVRRLAAEFARGRPKIAGRLEIDPDVGESDDPHVERLLEAFAFLTARIRHKLDDELPEITDALLNVLYPHYLAPVPSMAVVQFQLDPHQGQIAGGLEVPRGTKLYSREVRGLPCRFRTTSPATLWPIELSDVSFQRAPFGETIRLPSHIREPEALLRLELRCLGGLKFPQVQMDELRLFLSGDNRTVHQLHELLLKDVRQVVAGTPASPRESLVLTASCLKPVGFSPDDSMLPYGSQSFSGYRLLTEYFGFPEKFQFVDITGLSAARTRAMGDRLEILFLLDEADASLESRVDRKSIRLGCAPIVNLFEQRTDPIRISHTKSEYRVIPDVRHAARMEVYSITDVESVDVRTNRAVQYSPFFSYQHGDERRTSDAFWHMRRAQSLRAGDAGTDVHLSLVDLDFNPKSPACEELLVSTLCTNRDLAGELRQSGGQSWDFQVEGKLPVRRIEPIVMPTAPRRLPLSENYWRLVSHLSLNHLSITDGASGADALREILRLYDYSDSPVTQQQISGVLSVSSRRRTARVTDGFHSGFARGIEITVELDPERFAGRGLYLFSSVLDRFLPLYASINSFTCLVTRLKGQREPYKIWPIRIGERTLL